MGASSVGRPLAVISGGLGDIGRAIAVELATRFGADVAIGDVRPESEADPFLQALGERGADALYTRVDVADASAVEAWLDAVAERFGRSPDWVIPNAAIVTLKDVRTVTPDEWNRELAVNLTGGFYLAQSAARRLLERGLPGRIVFVGSWAGEAVHTGLPAYCVSKAGLRMLMRCLALDLAPDGILVNEVAPGFVDAGLSGRIYDADPPRRDASRAKTPNRTLMTAEDVARQVAYLCDPENRHCVGMTLLVDGGLSLITPGSGG